MTKNASLIFLILNCLALISCGTEPSVDMSQTTEVRAMVSSAKPDFVEILVGYNCVPAENSHNDFTGSVELEEFNIGSGNHPKAKLFEKVRVRRLKLPERANLEKILNHYRKNECVIYAEENVEVYLNDLNPPPNDPGFDKQWGLHNTGQTIAGDSGTRKGTVDADINALEAWETVRSGAVTVAIIDTGIDSDHTDLAGNIDQANGWNTILDSNNFEDDHLESHGTHVAGIIGAITDNQEGIAGLNWEINLLPIKALDANGGSDAGLSQIVKAIDYATQKGVQVINASYSYPSGCRTTTPSRSERIAIYNARQAGILFVAAAGNYGCDNDTYPTYPASHPVADNPLLYGTSSSTLYEPVDNIIAVAASDQNDNLANWSGGGSNFGLHSVHLAAPGINIYSTIIDGYGFLSGTSMAAPYVSGAAALLLANNSSLSHTDLIDRLVSSVDIHSDFSTKTISGGRLNIAKALTLDPTLPRPDAPTDLIIEASTGSEVTISWSPPATTVDGYRIERATESALFSTVGSAGPLATEFTDIVPEDGVEYHYRIRAYSGLSLSDYSEEVFNQPVIAPPGNFDYEYHSVDKTISLFWVNNSTSADSFVIERLTGTHDTFNSLITIPAIQTNYDDSSIDPGRWYSYRIKATNDTLGLDSDWTEISAFAGSLLNDSSDENACFMSDLFAESTYHNNLDDFRYVRDSLLASSSATDWIIDLYYDFSAVMHPIAINPQMNKILRASALPLVWLVDWLVPEPANVAWADSEKTIHNNRVF